MEIEDKGMAGVAKVGREHLAQAAVLDPLPAVLPVFGRRNLVVAVALSVSAFMILLAYQVRFGIDPFGRTLASHYVYLAQSLLHGRRDVAMPADTGDLVRLHGKQYVAYAPFPAFMLLPFVAIFGLSTSDVLFTSLISATIPASLYLLFEQARARGLTQRPWIEHLILSIFCYLGSITLWLSLGGCVWYTGHIVAMAFTLPALLLALRRHFTWSAVLFSCAFLSRYTVALGLPFLFYLAWNDAGAERNLERFVASLRSRRLDWTLVPWRRFLPMAAAIGVALAFLVLRNVTVFGSPTETGYSPLLQQTQPGVKYGLFSLRYVPANIIADFFSFPRVIFHGQYDRHPALDMLNGGPAISVFATTPLFLLLFWRNRRFSPLRAALWLTIGLVVAAMLPYQSVGWDQFGARYLYEAYPYAFLLLALNDVRIDLRFAALGLLGIVVNALGAHQFWTFGILHL